MIRTALALFLLLTPALHAEKKPPITEQDVSTFQLRFDALKDKGQRVVAYLETAEKTGKTKEEDLERSYKYLRLNTLSALLDLERDLIILATPSETITAEVEVPGLTSRECDRIPDLRLEITLAERERIKQGLATKNIIPGDDRFHKDLLKKEESLWDLYKRAAKKLDREIKKIEKSLTKEEESSIPDDDEIDELRTELDKLLEEKKSLFQPVFGYALGSRFEPPFTLPLDSAEQLRLAIKAEREATIKILREGETNKGEDGARGGIVGGSYLYSENLGVILDVSGSMTRFIEPLKTEIAQTFESPHYHEVVGCSLQLGTRYPSSPLHTKDTRRTIDAIEELLVVQEVDTVYWFNDLQDSQTYRSIRHLRHLLTHTGAAFHVKSVGKSPSRNLDPLIDDFQQD